MRFKLPSDEAIQRIRGDISDYEMRVKTGGEKNTGYEYRRSNALYDAFTTQDIVFYFRDKSIEKGKRYYISLEKDRGIIARLKKENGFSSRELVNIIDFLFEECDYIQNPTINILGSRWINTLSIDAENWKSGNYTPRSIEKKKDKLTEERNYQGDNEHKIKISDW